MKNEVCERFDLLISNMEQTKPGFRLKDLAVALNCSTERIRKVRKGELSLSIDDIVVLSNEYHASVNYLLFGVGPMYRPNDIKILGEEMQEYEAKQIETLQKLVASNESVIALQREKIAELQLAATKTTRKDG